MVDENDYLKDSLVDKLTQQLSEIEFLKSMYPKENEILIDHKNIDSIQLFLDSKSEYIPQDVDLTVNITRNKQKFEISINLPTLYPKVLPNINVRCNQLNRQNESKLNLLLYKYLKDNHVGDPCIYTAITWLQEYIDDNEEHLSSIEITPHNTLNIEGKESKFIRMWIMSHHIYNKRKREEILKKAKEGGLTGFCLPGKPGIICYEGPETICNESWKDIRSMTWKKIGVKKVEELNCEGDKRFDKFQEFSADMSAFSKFMEQNKFTDIFNELFGL